MPELAEVEFHRKQWDPGKGRVVARVFARRHARVFRENAHGKDFPRLLQKCLFLDSEACGKQMLFTFQREGRPCFLGIHLGMTGCLVTRPSGRRPDKHEHLVLQMGEGRDLVFRDPRQFGKVLLAEGPAVPVWWRDLAPPLLSEHFTADEMRGFLRRRAKTSLKGVLLMQERFPGIGNWMADEILWRARLGPDRLAGCLSAPEESKLHRAIRHVCRGALKTIGKDYSDPPVGWLFSHRWKNGHGCPRCGELLKREKLAGRTTCWCPQCQD